MAGAVGFAIILFAMALLVHSHGNGDIAGLAPSEFAALASGSALALVVASGIVNAFRGRWTSGLLALAAWALIGLALVGAYSYRDDLQDVALRLVGEIAPGRAVVAPGGEIVVTRRANGSFTLNGRANERDLRFVFDTGASMVVLTAESARALGIRPAERDYVVPVSTANGETTAAPVTLDQIAIGPIVERRIRALVARPGVLRENLLGMTFLDRLASYEVRQNRLILRSARGQQAS